MTKEIKKLNRLVLNEYSDKITLIEYSNDFGINVEDHNNYTLVHLDKDHLKALAEMINDVLAKG